MFFVVTTPSQSSQSKSYWLKSGAVEFEPVQPLGTQIYFKKRSLEHNKHYVLLVFTRMPTFLWRCSPGMTWLNFLLREQRVGFCSTRSVTQQFVLVWLQWSVCLLLSYEGELYMTDGTKVKLRRWKCSFVPSGVVVSANPPCSGWKSWSLLWSAVKSIAFRACACLGQYSDLLSRPVKVCHLFPSRWWLMMPSGNWSGGGGVLFLFVNALRSSLQQCTWTATAQLRKDEDWGAKIRKNEKSRSLKLFLRSCYHILERQA